MCDPRPGLSVKHKRRIIVQARYLLDRYPDASPYDIHSLIDTGCEIPGVVGWELIDKRYSEDADVQFNLWGAGNLSLEGGKVGVRVTVLLPVYTSQGMVVPRCVDAFLHLPSVGPRVILGYPFPTCYGLSLLPSQGQLTEQNFRTNRRVPNSAQPCSSRYMFSNRYTHSTNTCACA